MSIVNRSSDSLLSALFAKAGKLSAEVIARSLGVSPQSVRTWREALESGEAIELRAHVREKILAYVDGRPATAPDVAELLAAHQRELADLARDYTRRIVDAVSANIDQALSQTSIAGRVSVPTDDPEVLRQRERTLAAVAAVKRSEAAPPHRPAAGAAKRRPKAG